MLFCGASATTPCCIFCFLRGYTVNVNYVDAKYYIGSFNGDEFPLSIDNCNPLDILGANGYQIAECVDESTLMWNYYSDSSCTTFVTSVEYNSTWQTGNGTLNDFNCDNSATDSYAEIEFEAFGCGTSVKVTMYAAIGVCAFLVDSEISIQAYCEPEFAELYYFDSTDKTGATCDSADLFNVANVTGECGFMLKASGTKIFGQVCGHITATEQKTFLFFFVCNYLFILFVFETGA